MTQMDRIPVSLPEFVGFEMTADLKEVERHSKSVDNPCSPEGAVITPEFAEQSADEDSQTYACIPRGEYGGVCGASL